MREARKTQPPTSPARKGKMTALRIMAVSAMLTALFLIGAGQASAAPKTVLCEQNATKCEGEDAYAASTVLEAKLKEGTKTTVTGSALPVECSTSSLTVQTNAQSGAPLSAKVTAWNFGKCSVLKGTISCTSTALNLPYEAGIERSGGGSGKLTLTSGSGGVPSLRFTCPGGNAECIFGASNGQLSLEGGSSATIVSAVALKKEFDAHGNCGGAGTLSANYDVSKPAPLYVTDGILGPGLTSFCSANEETCAEGNLYQEGTEFVAGLSNFAEISGFALPLKCNSGTLEGEFQEGPQESGDPQMAEIYASTLSNCTMGSNVLSHKFDLFS